MIVMLSRDTLLDIVKNFLFFRVEFGNATKVITRYMQYRASNRIVERVIRSLKGEEDKDKGLIWHWQGSGKTLTMIFAANKLYYMRELENPTIFFIVDRIELEDQLYSEFYALDIVEPEIIGSVWELKDILKFDDYRSKRGIFIILIHKFRPEELKEVYGELEKISRRKETIMNRKNIVAFVDEGHRTQYGLLATQMKAILKNAFFFALTGTPISKRGRDTYLEFSYPPEEPYLDRYFITDSIKDGFTVKIVYQPRLEKDVHLKKDQLEAFLETELEELPEEIREGVEDKVKKRLNANKVVLENPFRIKTIAEDIAKHFKENIDGKFKAMVVAGSRNACEVYKRELDKHLPKEYSEIVMTYTEHDKPEIVRYVAEARARYGGKDVSDIRKDVIEKFKEEEFPKILIVTDMLLTGFDVSG
jgi:type I restriction enzyme R subunit